MIWLLTGQPGTGKSTLAVQHAINRYAASGRRVVANFPIDFAPVCRRAGSKLSRAYCEVIPDRPSRADLDAIGIGAEEEREECFGLLIVDEAGVWLNSRSWQGGEREPIIDWLSQSRKHCWDVILIAQGAEMVDKQVRRAICEGVVTIRRLDRLKFMGLPFPRVHIGICRYGLDVNAPVLERWFYRGSDAHKCFGSYRLFGRQSAHYCVLPATLSVWRYRVVWTVRDALLTFLAALGLGPYAGFPMPSKGPVTRSRSIERAAAGRSEGGTRGDVPRGASDPVRRGPQLLPLVKAVRDAMEGMGARGARGHAY